MLTIARFRQTVLTGDQVTYHHSLGTFESEREQDVSIRMYFTLMLA